MTGKPALSDSAAKFIEGRIVIGPGKNRQVVLEIEVEFRFTKELSNIEF
ncbi:MAG: hypothetical protein HY717_16205 [Planctomycetes bacterium]|nr:hypothetical protein [Planctomycetota bacterium]